LFLVEDVTVAIGAMLVEMALGGSGNQYMTTPEVLNERSFELNVTDLFHSVSLAFSAN
jgi:hypothetical protein